MRARALYGPRPVRVTLAGPGAGPARPGAVAGAAIEAVREEWLVEDGWWTGVPLRRRYLELVLAGGRCTTVFCDLPSGAWFEQR